MDSIKKMKMVMLLWATATSSCFTWNKEQAKKLPADLQAELIRKAGERVQQEPEQLQIDREELVIKYFAGLAAKK